MNDQNSLTLTNGNLSVQLQQRESTRQSIQTSVEVSRAAREIEAALIVAKSRKRDILDAYAEIMQACKRSSFAEKALYIYPRGGQKVEGATIRLMECIARAYGNLDFGWRELERGLTKSTVEAYCWDLERNSKHKKVWDVALVRDTKQGRKELTDERDIYEHIANQASRRVRACIESMIPSDLIEEAKDQCRETMKAGINSTNKNDYVKKIVLAFEEIGVTNDQLKAYLGVEKVLGATENQMIELRKIYTAIKEGAAMIKDYFPSLSDKKESHFGVDALNKKLENVTPDKSKQ